MLIVVAPGQGSQTPGMLEPWLELPGFAAAIDAAGASCGLDLRSLGTTADAETIRDTAIAQPLIVAAGLASAAVAGELVLTADAVAGHSVGEFTAAALAGVITPAEALQLVGVRGRAMAAAAALAPTGMAAVLGGERAEVVATLEAHGLVPANENGANQIVAAGPKAALEALAAAPPAGAKVIALQVAGAFHTSYMASARADLETAVAAVTPATATVPVVSNRDAAVLTDGAEIAARLVSQVTSPVRWDLCMNAFAGLGVTGIVELFPGGTLTGIAKRALPGVELLPLKSPADLPALGEFADRHHGATPSAS